MDTDSSMIDELSLFIGKVVLVLTAVYLIGWAISLIKDNDLYEELE